MKSIIPPHDLLVAFLAVQNVLERRAESFFKPYRLTGAQFNILNLLEMSQGRMEQAELIQNLLVGKSSISIVLNRMVRDGLVKRKEHDMDRRQVVLVLQKKGRDLWSKVAPSYFAHVDLIFGAVPERRRKALMQDLNVVEKALKDEGKKNSK